MKISLLKAVFLCLLLTGCQATHLVYVHGTTMGLEVAASTEGGTGRMVFGYDRETFALIPRISNQTESDAMSLAAVSCVYAKGLDDVQFRHFVSTGGAAINIVKNKKVLKSINNSIQGDGEKCKPE